MRIEAVPALVMEKNIAFGKRFAVYSEGDEFFEGKRVKQYAKRVGRVPELEIIQFLPYVYRKARTERQHPAVVINGITAFWDGYLGCELHEY